MHAADELADPVSYEPVWWVVAAALLVTVLAWNLGVAWWGRPHRVRTAAPEVADLDDVRRRHLAELDRVEAEVRAGRMALREGFQALSATARSFVHETSDVPARYLALADLRRADVPLVVAAVEVMYPPEFAPDAGQASEAELAEALRRARQVVTASWT